MERYEGQNFENMGGVHGDMRGESSNERRNFNVNEVEERINEALDNYNRAFRRYVPVQIEVVDFLKTQFGPKKVDGIKVVDLKTDQNGVPTSLIFDILHAGTVIEQYRNSEVILDQYGKLHYRLNIGGGHGAANQGGSYAGGGYAGGSGFTSRGHASTGYHAGQQQAVAGVIPKSFKIAGGVLIATTLISIFIAFKSVNSAASYKETSITNKSTAEQYEQQINDVYAALNAIGYKFENGKLEKIN